MANFKTVRASSEPVSPGFLGIGSPRVPVIEQKEGPAPYDWRYEDLDDSCEDYEGLEASGFISGKLGVT